MDIFLEELKRVSMYDIFKETWDILEITNDGTKTVKILNYRC